jgi:hypothetical protein
MGSNDLLIRRRMGHAQIVGSNDGSFNHTLSKKRIFLDGKGVPLWKGKGEMVGVEDLQRRFSILAGVKPSR